MISRLLVLFEGREILTRLQLDFSATGKREEKHAQDFDPGYDGSGVVRAGPVRERGIVGNPDGTAVGDPAHQVR